MISSRPPARAVTGESARWRVDSPRFLQDRKVLGSSSGWPVLSLQILLTRGSTKHTGGYSRFSSQAWGSTKHTGGGAWSFP